MAPANKSRWCCEERHGTTLAEVSCSEGMRVETRDFGKSSSQVQFPSPRRLILLNPEAAGAGQADFLIAIADVEAV